MLRCPQANAVTVVEEHYHTKENYFFDRVQSALIFSSLFYQEKRDKSNGLPLVLAVPAVLVIFEILVLFVILVLLVLLVLFYLNISFITQLAIPKQIAITIQPTTPP